MGALLDGIYAVGFASHGVGPIAGVILGQFGADVIKIESPVGGDPTRGYNRPGPKVPPGNHGISFEFTNRNTKSMTIDLNKEKGREIAYKLIGKSDVFFSNYLPYSLKRIGLDYETLSQYNPKLVYTASSAYGKEGPDNNKRAFDPLVLARSGLMLASGEADGPPIDIRGTIADTLAGTFLAFSVIAGLLARERVGVGQEISTSLFAAMIWLQQANVQQFLYSGQGIERQSRMGALNPIANNYKCKDGRWIKVSSGTSDDPRRDWHDFCRLLDIESIEKDPRFDNAIKRQDNSEELIKILDKAFLSKTCHEWQEHFKTQNAGFLYEAIQQVSELVDDPQVLANNYIVEEDHPNLGHIKRLPFPMDFGKTPIVPAPKPAPQLGEHTDEIMLKIGYSMEEITEMRKNRII